VELYSYPEEGGFLFALTAVRVKSPVSTTLYNTMMFRNDIDGMRSKVQVLDQEGRRFLMFIAYGDEVVQ
jgi:hypothetical protein